MVVEPRRSQDRSLGPLAPGQGAARPLLFALRRLARPRAAAAAAAARASADMRIRRLTEMLLQPLGLPAGRRTCHRSGAGPAGRPLVGAARRDRCAWPLPPRLDALGAGGAGSRSAGADGKDVGPGRRAPSLPGAVAEVERWRASTRPRRASRRPASTADGSSMRWPTPSLVHLACHGTLRADNPMFSSLLLSDGPLTVQELYARGLAPRRLVLAACESGSLVGYAGDEVLGFVSALLARGTAGIIASTSAVPDVEAVDLMTAVHRRLAARRHPGPRAARGPGVNRHRGPRPLRQLVHVQRPRGRLTGARPWS